MCENRPISRRSNVSHRPSRRLDAKASQPGKANLFRPEFAPSTPELQEDEETDPLADFDPDSDASCWDPGDLEMEEAPLDQHDFCWDDADYGDD
jgi:hypothetical protein